MLFALRVSKMSDQKTLCRPASGYESQVKVNLEKYEQIGKIDFELPECDLEYPKGAPILNLLVFDGKIYELKHL